MKKSLILITFLFAFINMHAQHISFMGIHLGQSGNVVHNFLLQKGFNFDGDISFTQNKRYRGPFWIFNDVVLSTEIESNKVTAINISPTFNTFDRISDYNNLVRNLDKKYGKHYPISNFFKYSYIADNEGYYWKVSGGYIVVFYSERVNTDKIMIFLSYMDYTNKIIRFEIGRNRNKNNDL